MAASAIPFVTASASGSSRENPECAPGLLVVLAILGWIVERRRPAANPDLSPEWVRYPPF